MLTAPLERMERLKSSPKRRTCEQRGWVATEGVGSRQPSEKGATRARLGLSAHALLAENAERHAAVSTWRFVKMFASLRAHTKSHHRPVCGVWGLPVLLLRPPNARLNPAANVSISSC